MPGKLIEGKGATVTATAMLPESHVAALKTSREFEYDRKQTLKSAKRKARNSGTTSAKSDKSELTLHPKGGYLHTKVHQKVGRYRAHLDEVIEEKEETDWVAEVGSRPELREVPLVDLLKPAKPRQHSPKADDFEVIPKMRSVIALDEQMASSPEVDEPWEELDFEDDDQTGRASPRTISYAEIAASA